MRNRSSVIIIEDQHVALIKRMQDGRTYYVFPGGGIEKERHQKKWHKEKLWKS